MYIARQLSFHGVSFSIKEVELSEDFIDMYDAAVELVCVCTMYIHVHACIWVMCIYVLSVGGC